MQTGVKVLSHVFFSSKVRGEKYCAKIYQTTP